MARAGCRVGSYRILEPIGRGGMGIVHRGVHERLGRDVAVKVLAPELTRDDQFRERFFNEARTQARLQHPHIVTVYDLLEEAGEFFIVMELVEGRSLDRLLADGRLSLERALGLFQQILSALDFAHSRGVIHRDVKASNVLVTADDRVKLMDFGIALLVGDTRLTRTSQSIGTPVYMSPEQILRPREVDHRSDIYSAAVVLFEMLAGVPPFDGDTDYEIQRQHVERSFVDVVATCPAVPSELAVLLARALAKTPADRFDSAGEMSRALSGVTPAVPSGTSPPVVAPRPAARRRRPVWSRPGRRWGVLAGGFGLAAVLTLVLRGFGAEAGVDGFAGDEPTRAQGVSVEATTLGVEPHGDSRIWTVVGASETGAVDGARERPAATEVAASPPRTSPPAPARQRSIPSSASVHEPEPRGPAGVEEFPSPDPVGAADLPALAGADGATGQPEAGVDDRFLEAGSIARRLMARVERDATRDPDFARAVDDLRDAFETVVAREELEDRRGLVHWLRKRRPATRDDFWDRAARVLELGRSRVGDDPEDRALLDRLAELMARRS